jgi:hypothetical protein
VATLPLPAVLAGLVVTPSVWVRADSRAQLDRLIRKAAAVEDSTSRTNGAVITLRFVSRQADEPKG